ncbi:bile salt-activated lipase-like [Cydia strobilella]|uniref:bile salt-activated lipase-like n=1 Tax=Cydia strobilella TaxID=1100964 RepID=UPI003005013D
MRYSKNLVLFSLFAANLVDQPAPEVEIAQGRLSGKVSNDGLYFEYVGIPYATTNHSTRFQAPGLPPSWKGTFKATDRIYMCPQNSQWGRVGREDCLTINVYVPTMPLQRPLPVMVFIHGGAFDVGSGGKFVFGPDYLVKHEVIIVTFNYRLGALGFMCLNIKEAPGNAGLKDQLAALRWVKKNIAAFGGDPDNVTAFGESAGATSLSILVASDASDGLFQRAIIQSGSSITNWAINRKPVWVYSLIAKQMGYDTEDPHELYNIFKDLPVADLIGTKPKKPLDKFLDAQLFHIPCIEKPFPGVEPIITDLPYNIIQKKKLNISIIYGSNSKEGLFRAGKETPASLNEKNGRYLFASDLEFKTELEAEEAAKEVKEFYFGEEYIDMSKILNMSDLYTHLYYETPLLIESEVLIKNTDKPIYNYYFDYAGSRNIVKVMSGYRNSEGACHADDLFYLFKPEFWPNYMGIWNKKDNEIIDTMTKLWTNFAKYGNPTPESATDLPRWSPSSREGLKLLYIGKEVKMGPLPNHEAYEMWRRMYTTYRRKTI